MRNKKWVRLLAYVTGSVNQELLLQNEYLAAELRAKLPSRLRRAIPSLLRRHAGIGVDWLGTRDDQPPLPTW